MQIPQIYLTFQYSEYLQDESFQDVTCLAAKLEKLKNYMALDSMAYDLGIIQTLAELKKRVQEITGNSRNALTYKDCAMTMLGRRSTICQRRMRYSGQDEEFEKKPCWLDRLSLSFVSRFDFSFSSGLQSPITHLPPPPPPSPADIGAMENTGTYPAA
ncbi:allograft inflammatory factor 1-like isoform X3 [Dendropsophus ebraccatus]|uniref:allograft inflammatory factor 1-like isoform X3 n=1 Tax=Dendropsophus ebraccatus TaxID=150705 RepID=UPI0038318762